MSTPLLPAAVLWDMDGTLIDTEPMWMGAETVLAASHGVTWTHADGLASLGNPLPVTAAHMRDRGVIASDEEIIEALLRSVTAQVHEGVPWHEDAKQLLMAIVDAGIPCALVTASHAVLAQVVVAQVPGVFSAVVTGDEDIPGKPNPAPYLEAAARLGVDIADCVVIEDSPAGTLAGVRSGALTVGIHREVAFEHHEGMKVLTTLADVAPATLTQWVRERGRPGG